jgi:hypothetical protein
VSALAANTTGVRNVAIGANALQLNESGGQNTAVGWYALNANLGSDNTAVGQFSSGVNTTGIRNVSFGSNTLAINETGNRNTALGYYALNQNLSGSENTAVGHLSARNNLTGSGNVMLGNFAGAYELGSDSFYVNNRDRSDTANEKAKSLLYGTFNDAPASQTLTVNAKLTATYGVVTRVNSQTTTTSPWAWNSDSYDQQEITALANALTINADAGTPSNGQQTIFRFTDNGTARALTWTTGTSKSFRAVGVLLPTTTIANKTLYVGCVYNSTAARWDVLAVAQEA